jgi:hypothetical protein
MEPNKQVAGREGPERKPVLNLTTNGRNVAVPQLGYSIRSQLETRGIYG